jgi:hypothetical protein
MTDQPTHDPVDRELAELIASAPLEEREELAALAQRLEQRPVPRAGLRAALHARVAAVRLKPRPPHLRRLVAAYLGSGALLLALAAAGLAGVGPLSG